GEAVAIGVAGAEVGADPLHEDAQLLALGLVDVPVGTGLGDLGLELVEVGAELVVHRARPYRCTGTIRSSPRVRGRARCGPQPCSRRGRAARSRSRTGWPRRCRTPG